jgi:uncharacterized OsmC-like protein
MSQQLLKHSVRTATTDTFGRTLNSTRMHHYVIDGTQEPAEEITPVEVFLSSVSACAVQHVERWSREDGVTIAGAVADIEGVRFADRPERFDHVTLRIEVRGATQEQAERYVAKYQGHCPLYGTLATATDIRVETVAHPEA